MRYDRVEIELDIAEKKVLEMTKVAGDNLMHTESSVDKVDGEVAEVGQLHLSNVPVELRWKLKEEATKRRKLLGEFVVELLVEVSARFGEGERATPSGGGKRREVGERIRGQVERLSRKAEAQELEDDLKF